MGKKDKKSRTRQSPQASSTTGNTSWDTDSTVPPSVNDEDASTVATDMELKDSMERLDERSDLEKDLFELIANEQYEAAKQLISEHRQDIDINHKNLEGHDLVTHAVETKNKKMVSLALNVDPEKVDAKEALLHAIKEGKMGIMLMLLHFEDKRHGGAMYATTKMLMSTHTKQSKSKHKKKRGSSDKDVQSDSFDQSEFGCDITPLMQAAMHGHYEIMQVLYNRGERLPRLHLQSCDCPSCKWATRDLERTQRRINLFKAMSNSTYIIFMACQDGSFDPVLEVIDLMGKLEQCIGEEPEYKDDYEEILEEVSKLPVDLLDMCRTTEETKIFLCQQEGFDGPTSMPYPRLALTIEHEYKELVAHPNVQFLIENEFYGSFWHAKGSAQLTAKFLMTLLMMFFYPLVQIYIWFGLFCGRGSSHIRTLLSPLNRSLNQLAAQIYFCVLIFVMNMTERTEGDIEPPTQYVRFVVIMYTASLLLVIIRRLMQHPREFFRSGWNIFDCITQILFWVTFGLWILLFKRKYELGFEITLSRRKLPADDCLLIAECIFAVASTCATLRLLRWYILSPFLGPFQAGLHRMAEHIKTIMIFMTWTVLAFSLSSKILFRPYLNLTKLDNKAGVVKDQPKDFTELEPMLMDFFGGDVGPDKLEIFPVNRSFVNANGVQEQLTYEQETTQWTAWFMCLMWNVIGIKFLKETVTGLFGSTGDEVLKAKDVEWKYERAREMLYFIRAGHLAPPFNLLPHGACMASVFAWIYALTCGKGDKTEAGCTCYKCCYMSDVESPEEQEEKIKEYPWLLRNLFQRYFKVKMDGDEEEEATKEEVNEVQEKMKEIKELCQSMLDVLETPPKKESSGGGLHTPPNTHPSESNSMQTQQGLRTPPSKTLSNQQAGGASSVQVMVSPKAQQILSP